MDRDKGYTLRRLERTNALRLRFYLPILALVHIIHVMIFYLLHGLPEDYERWHSQIIISHLVASVVTAGLYVWIRKRRLVNVEFGARALAVFYFLFAVLITLIDQKITQAITPYLVACMGLSVGLFLPYRFTLPLYLAGLILFVVGLHWVGAEPEVALSNSVNALTVTAVGWTLGVIFWRFRYRALEQTRFIALQTFRLRKSNQKLTETMASRQRIFSILAHDLRGPISASSTALKHLGQDWSGIADDEKRDLIIRQSASLAHSHELLDDLLNWASRAEGGLPYKPRTIDLLSIYLETEKGFREMARQASVTLSAAVDSNLQVHADYSMLQSVLRNLLSNAIKFSPGGEMVEFYGTRTEAGQARISVRDRGPGLSVEQMEATYRGDTFAATPIAGFTGSGVGLYLIRDFLRAHDSMLEVSRRPEGGTDFSFQLPLASLRQ